MVQEGLVAKGIGSEVVQRVSTLAFSLKSQKRRRTLLVVEVFLAILATVILWKTPRNLDHVTKDSSAVLWDATSIGRDFIAPLHAFLGRVKGYSWYHGPGRYKSVSVSDNQDRAILSENTTLFCHSLQEVDGYHQTLDVSLSRIKTVGITRHHPDWIETLHNYEAEKAAPDKKNTLLIISRQEKIQRIPTSRKLEYLRDIREASTLLGLHIKVKPHPKESNFEHYYQVFGPEGPTHSWSLTDKQITLLAQETMFAVCFRSYACLDLTVMGVPTIERLNLIGLAGYDNGSSYRDETGAPILEIRCDGHVLGASTSEEFFARVNEVVNNYEDSIESLQDAYRAYYLLPVTSPRKIASKILLEVQKSHDFAGRGGDP